MLLGKAGALAQAFDGVVGARHHAIVFGPGNHGYQMQQLGLAGVFAVFLHAGHELLPCLFQVAHPQLVVEILVFYIQVVARKTAGLPVGVFDGFVAFLRLGAHNLDA